ncbi:Hypothetical protein NTJ_06484 [Nesidiocoris tenuis]|nr:Hypothetical protein NTJ_06484 [Nesidiocoris tenuis]
MYSAADVFVYRFATAAKADPSGRLKERKYLGAVSPAGGGGNQYLCTPGGPAPVAQFGPNPQRWAHLRFAGESAAVRSAHKCRA